MTIVLEMYSTPTVKVDVSDDLLEFSVNRGLSPEGFFLSQAQGATGSFTLRNAHKYNPFLTTATRYSESLPGRYLRLLDDTTPLWGGHVAGAPEVVDGLDGPTAIINGVGPLGWYVDARGNVWVDPLGWTGSESPSSAYVDAALAALWTPYNTQGVTLKSVDAGALQINHGYGASSGILGDPLNPVNVIGMMQKLALYEQGLSYDGRSGSIVYRNRGAVDTMLDAATPVGHPLTSWRTIRRLDSSAQVYNDVYVVGTQGAVVQTGKSIGVLWFGGSVTQQTISAPSGTVVRTWRVPTDFEGYIVPGGSPLMTTGTEVATPNITWAIDQVTTSSARYTVSGIAPANRIRANISALVDTDLAPFSARVLDTPSQGLYGRRTLQLQNDVAVSQAPLDSMAATMLARMKDMRRVYRVGLMPDTPHLDIGSIVTMENDAEFGSGTVRFVVIGTGYTYTQRGGLLATVDVMQQGPYVPPVTPPPPPPVTHSQTITLPAARYTRSAASKFWSWTSPGPAFDDAFEVAGQQRFLFWLVLGQVNRQVTLNVTDATGTTEARDLSNDFETMGILTITIDSGESLTLNMADYTDTAEPYLLVITDAAKQAEFDALFGALSTVNGTEEATLTLGVP